MKELEISYTIQVFDRSDQLPDDEQGLINAATQAMKNAYAPYSNFTVGCAVLLDNNEIVSGSNQENASYPAGICAERVTLSSASALFPNIPVNKMAIVVPKNEFMGDDPVAPCGICRQSIHEYEVRFDRPISLLLQANGGSVYRLASIKDIFPFGFKLSGQ